VGTKMQNTIQTKEASLPVNLCMVFSLVFDVALAA